MNTAIAVMLALAASGQVATDVVPSDEVDDTFEVLKAFYRQEVAGYAFSLDAAGKEKLALSKPVLTWTGQDFTEVIGVIGATTGEVYIWTRNGRAVVAGGAGSFGRPNSREVFHEFHALTETPPAPIEIKCRPPKVWIPPGAELKPIPGAPAPVTAASEQLTESLRLSQMRKLAQEFSAETRTPQGNVNRLEMRPAPIYRLDTRALAESDLITVDGAIFAFTGGLGTDPEMLLLIECQKSDEGLRWMYFPAQFTFLATTLEHKGDEVWEVPLKPAGVLDQNFVSEITETRISLDAIRERVGE